MLLLLRNTCASQAEWPLLMAAYREICLRVNFKLLGDGLLQSLIGQTHTAADEVQQQM
jgi:hypothetical protein